MDMAAPLRERMRPRMLWLAVALWLAACSSAPTVSTERGVRRCDRNGDYEERMACNP
jgi:hypothetical protein